MGVEFEYHVIFNVKQKIRQEIIQFQSGKKIVKICCSFEHRCDSTI